MLLVFVSMLWTSNYTYYEWMINPDVEVLELCELPDNDAEKETEKTEKNPEIKVRFAYHQLYHNMTEELVNHLTIRSYQTLHIGDIPTPPPKTSF